VYGGTFGVFDRLPVATGHPEFSYCEPMKLPFRNRDFRPFLLLCGLLAVVWFRHHPRGNVADGRPVTVTVDQAQDLFPDAVALVPGQEKYPSRTVLDADRAPLGVLILSGPDTARITGYGGPTPLAVGLDDEGDVFGVVLLENAESESYLMDVLDSGLQECWNGLPVDRALTKTVDAVSGATMSSSAIIETLHATLQPLVQVKQAAPPPSSRVTGTMLWLWLVLILDIALFCFRKRLRRLRTWFLLANVAVIGFLAGSMLSLAQASGWSIHGIPQRVWLTTGAMAFLAVLLPLFTGRDFYCSHVCPYGACQELLGKLRRSKVRTPGWLGGWLRTLRGAVLGTAWLGLAVGVAQDLTVAEPFAAFHLRAAPLSVLVLAGAFLLVSLFIPRAWCRLLCPTGRLLTAARGKPRAPGAPRGALLSFSAFSCLLLVVAGCWLAWTASFVPPQTAVDVLSVIHGRRSVRHYTDEPIAPEQIETLLRAGMAAPTAGNAQPWSFVVVIDRDRLGKLAEGLEYGKMLAKAGAAIVVCGRPDDALPGEANGMWVQDCSAASENILLAAHGIGLGAVWVGVYPIDERIGMVRQALGLPETVVPLNVISLGHPLGIERPKRKFDPDRVHWESWQDK